MRPVYKMANRPVRNIHMEQRDNPISPIRPIQQERFSKKIHHDFHNGYNPVVGPP